MKKLILLLALTSSLNTHAGTWDCKVSSTAPNGTPVAVAWSVMSYGQFVSFPQTDSKCLYVCGEDVQVDNPQKLKKIVLASNSCSVAGPAGSMYVEKDEFKPVSCTVEEAFLLAMCK